jgi:hypothetical protein
VCREREIMVELYQAVTIDTVSDLHVVGTNLG